MTYNSDLNENTKNRKKKLFRLYRKYQKYIIVTEEKNNKNLLFKTVIDDMKVYENKYAKKIYFILQEEGLLFSTKSENNSESKICH